MAETTFRAVQVNKLSKTVAEGIENLVVNEVQRTKLPPSKIRVKIHSSATNFFDLLITVGRYQHRPKLPHTIASEASGVVVEVGKSVKHVRVGDEVLMGMASECMAEEVVTSAMLVLPKPPGFTHAEAASFFVGYSTAYHGLLQRGHLKAGDTVLITGAAGGMGAAAIQLAKKIGATVIAAASSREKLEACKALGADHVINYKTHSLKKEVKKITKRGVDVVYEIVGGAMLRECISCIAPNGRLLVIGFASGEIPKIPANLVLVKGFQVVGVRAGAEFAMNPGLVREMAEQLREWTKDGSRDLAPLVQHQYSLSNFREAFRVLHERRVVGKATVNLVPPARSHL